MDAAGKMPVLCSYRFKHYDKWGERWVTVHDAIMIHVSSAAEIPDAFEREIDRRAIRWGVWSVGPRPVGWDLVSYMPLCGEARF